MMTPKMKEDFCTQILEQAGSSSFRAGSQRSAGEKGTQKQLEFILELLQAELTLRDETDENV